MQLIDTQGSAPSITISPLSVSATVLNGVIKPLCCYERTQLFKITEMTRDYFFADMLDRILNGQGLSIFLVIY